MQYSEFPRMPTKKPFATPTGRWPAVIIRIADRGRAPRSSVSLHTRTKRSRTAEARWPRFVQLQPGFAPAWSKTARTRGRMLPCSAGYPELAAELAISRMAYAFNDLDPSCKRLTGTHRRLTVE